MREFDQSWVWDEAAIRAALGWYREVAADRRPAKYRIAATIPIGLSIGESPEAALWAELAVLTPRFLETWRAIGDGRAALSPRPDGANLLDLCQALTKRMLGHCNFCQWDCGVDRTRDGKLGACKLGAESRVSTYFSHRGEELVYRGTEGSGTIFFTSCNMRCAFCQNGDISTDKDNGRIVDGPALAAMARRLRLAGCHNINWVGGEPTIHLHRIVEAIRLLADDAGVNAPMLWNSNFFMTEQAMGILRLVTDVWLPDFKFGPGRCAIELSRTPRYWECVTRNLGWLADWGEDLTIRHLVMPNHVDCCTRPILEWLAEHLPGAPVNIMGQYHPDTFTDPRSPAYQPRYETVARCPTRAEILAAQECARDLGLPFEAVTKESGLFRLSL